MSRLEDLRGRLSALRDVLRRRRAGECAYRLIRNEKIEPVTLEEAEWIGIALCIELADRGYEPMGDTQYSPARRAPPKWVFRFSKLTYQGQNTRQITVPILLEDYEEQHGNPT